MQLKKVSFITIPSNQLQSPPKWFNILSSSLKKTTQENITQGAVHKGQVREGVVSQFSTLGGMFRGFFIAKKAKIVYVGWRSKFQKKCLRSLCMSPPPQIKRFVFYTAEHFILNNSLQYAFAQNFPWPSKISLIFRTQLLEYGNVS